MRRGGLKLGEPPYWEQYTFNRSEQDPRNLSDSSDMTPVKDVAQSMSVEHEIILAAADTLSDTERSVIRSAVERGIDAYLKSRDAKTREFVASHFSIRGAFALQKKTLRRDLLKLPLNMLWALPAFTLHLLGRGLKKVGLVNIGGKLEDVPDGFDTALQQELRWLIYTELLELPYAQGERVSHTDRLLENILNQPEIAALCESYLRQIRLNASRPAFRESLERNLAEYGKSRVAAGELTSNLITLATGYAAFHQATPGVLAGGSAAAAAIAQHTAITHFWLGPTLGAWYYALFPTTASAGLIIATTGVLMTAVGLVSALAWIVMDPLLALTGFHERRLQRFIEALGNELRGQGGTPYRVRDHYIARVFDILDLLRTAARAAA